MRIKSLQARQIINSKGYPTLQIELSSSKNTVQASVPVAASKGRYEFVDHYDEKVKRFHHENLSATVERINRVVSPELLGKNTMDQENLDRLILELDNTLDRSHLGISVIAGLSSAIAKLGALESDLPLFKYIRVLHDFTGSNGIRLNSEYSIPLPIITVFRSSLHEESQNLPFQEIMVIPRTGFNYNKDLVKLFEQIHELRSIKSYSTLKSLLTDLSKSLSRSKLALGIDFAASRFKMPESNYYKMPHFHSSVVEYNGDGKKLVSSYLKFIKESKVTFIEDGFSEEDYTSWKLLTDEAFKADPSVQIASDDFTATNVERLEKISMLECANNVIIKPSQIGTISEAIHFVQLARKFNKKITVSYRFGETEDDFIADFACGINADYFRSGYYLGSEYNTKLNRLMQIESLR